MDQQTRPVPNKENSEVMKANQIDPCNYTKLANKVTDNIGSIVRRILELERVQMDFDEIKRKYRLLEERNAVLERKNTIFTRLVLYVTGAGRDVLEVEGEDKKEGPNTTYDVHQNHHMADSTIEENTLVEHSTFVFDVSSPLLTRLRRNLASQENNQSIILPTYEDFERDVEELTSTMIVPPSRRNVPTMRPNGGILDISEIDIQDRNESTVANPHNETPHPVGNNSSVFNGASEDESSDSDLEDDTLVEKGTFRVDTMESTGTLYRTTPAEEEKETTEGDEEKESGEQEGNFKKEDHHSHDENLHSGEENNDRGTRLHSTKAQDSYAERKQLKRERENVEKARHDDGRRTRDDTIVMKTTREDMVLMKDRSTTFTSEEQKWICKNMEKFPSIYESSYGSPAGASDYQLLADNMWKSGFPIRRDGETMKSFWRQIMESPDADTPGNVFYELLKSYYISKKERIFLCQTVESFPSIWKTGFSEDQKTADFEVISVMMNTRSGRRRSNCRSGIIVECLWKKSLIRSQEESGRWLRQYLIFYYDEMKNGLTVRTRGNATI